MPIQPFKRPAGSLGELIQSGIETRAAEVRFSEGRRVSRGHMVQTPGGAMNYKALLHYAEGADSEHPFATMRAGEAFFRSEAPMPPKPDTMREELPGGIPSAGPRS